MFSVMAVFSRGVPCDHIIVLWDRSHGTLPPDLVKLVHKWAALHISRPYIYWETGGWPSTEKLSCFIIIQIDAAIKFNGISMETPALIMTGN